MLEEALQDEKHNPNETAVAVLDFLNSIPLGGAASEARFCRNVFVPLCDRVFGPLVAGTGTEDSLRHKDSAWLATTQRWRSPSTPTGAPQSPHHRMTSPSSKLKKTWKDDPAVRLLDIPPSEATGKDRVRDNMSSSASSLLAAVTRESENRPSVAYPFDFQALPKSTQDAWMEAASLERTPLSTTGRPINAEPTKTSSLSDNHRKLFLELMRHKPSEQHELIAYRQHKMMEEQHRGGGPVTSPFQIKAPSFASPLRTSFPPPPSANYHAPTQNQDSKDPSSPSPMIRLGMLEYYLVSFLHFALTPPATLTASTSFQPSARTSPLAALQRYTPFGLAVYTHLFRQYCRYFLTSHASDRRTSKSLPQRDSDLFLRLVVALWIESQACLRTTMAVVTAWQEREQRRLGRFHHDSGPDTIERGYDLDKSYDLVVAQGKFTFHTVLVKECLPFFVQLALSDPQVQALVRRDTRSRSPASSSSSPSKGNMDTTIDWCLSDTMTSMQVPIYNYIRAAFRYAPIHSSSSSFYTAMNIWLHWLEPWNTTASHGPDQPSSNPMQSQILGRINLSHPSRRSYDPRQWEPYVAANLCLYTVPLAIFLRRARELDFSANNFQPAIQIVTKVFMVYTPELLEAITRHLRGDTPFTKTIESHFDRLGPFAPPNRKMSLSSCQSDMRLLLEEMHMHHNKKLDNMDILDWLSAKVEGLFGRGAVSGEEKSLALLVERAKLMVGLPDSYQIFPSRESARAVKVQAQGLREPARTQDGILTKEGREQLLRGEVVCSQLDVRSESDALTRSVVGTYEIGWLVTVTIHLSQLLNERLGLQHNRINLRGLADYRNLLFFCVSCYLVSKLLLTYLLS